MRRILIAFLLCLPIFAPVRLRAWGCVGHQVVAYIAAQNLSPAAQAQVTDLLSDAKYATGIRRFCGYTGLGKIEYFATWADDARDDSNAGWHFWDIPLASDTATMPQYCDQGCVVSALKAQVAILNSDADRPAKQMALMFLIHLAGDAHQPMHIVDNGDRGGNCVPVSFEYTGFAHKTNQSKIHGQPTGSYSPNLHSIWDDSVIQTMTGIENDSNRDQLTQGFADSVSKEYADQIAGAKATTVDLVNGADFSSWAIEAHKLAGPDSYNKLPADIPVNPHPQTLKSCAGVSSGFAALDEQVEEEYVENAKPVIRQQLAMAGARLAATLNTIWAAK